MEVYREIRSIHPELARPIHCLVSIGCGLEKQSLFTNSRWGRRNSQSRLEQYVVDAVMSKKGKEDREFDYYRFRGPPELAEVKLNNWKLDSSGKKTFRKIEIATKNFYNRPEIQAEIDRCAHSLVSCRQERSQTGEQWTRFAAVDECSSPVSPKTMHSLYG